MRMIPNTPDEEDLEYPGSNGHMLRDDFSKLICIY